MGEMEACETDFLSGQTKNTPQNPFTNQEYLAITTVSVNNNFLIIRTFTYGIVSAV